MGQYLSAPVTEKESGEGYNDNLGYAISAMQGWRVSMEDAHITELELDPHTKTSLFSVFDGHGGKAVAKFCAKYLAKELVSTAAYKRGDLRQAIVDTYYQLDLLLDSPEGRQELKSMVGGAARSKPPQALFSGVEQELHGADSASSDAAETDPLSSEGGSKGKALSKVPSEHFIQSHLMRASVIPPADSSQEHPQQHPQQQQHPPLQQPAQHDSEEGGGPGGKGAGGGGGGAAAGGAARPAAAAAAGGGDAGHDCSDEEEGDEQPAAGMGCTAVSVLVRGDLVLVANTGDSRCVLSRRGQAIALTLDHKPILFEEAQRIIRAGGFVRDNRINGALNVSRTIGDLDFKRNAELPPSKQMVVATPDVESFKLREGDEFLILACDGIWDVMSNQEAVDYVRKKLKQGMRLQAICESMCDDCLATDLKGLCRGADNMSVVIILFRKYANLGGFWNRLLASICKFSSSSSSGSKRNLGR